MCCTFLPLLIHNPPGKQNAETYLAYQKSKTYSQLLTPGSFLDDALPSLDCSQHYFLRAFCLQTGCSSLTLQKPNCIFTFHYCFIQKLRNYLWKGLLFLHCMNCRVLMSLRTPTKPVAYSPDEACLNLLLQLVKLTPLPLFIIFFSKHSHNMLSHATVLIMSDEVSPAALAITCYKWMSTLWRLIAVHCFHFITFNEIWM